MYAYQYQFNVIAGRGAVSGIGKKLQEMGLKKALICCDEGIVQFGILKKVTEPLDEAGIPYAVYDRVLPNPLERNVTEACGLAKKEEIDCFVAVGGGSSMDTAKAASILLANGKLVQEDITKPPVPGLPVIAVPTTSGTGSDLSIGAMISDNNTHAKIAVPTPTAALSICDPELTRSLPKGATLAGAVDAMMHAIEGYTSICASKYSDLICENCIQAVHKYLPLAMENGNDMQAREELMFAASSCGSVIATAYLHAGHAVGHTIGGALNIVHGLAVVVAAPQMLKIITRSVPEKTRKIGELLGMEIPADVTGEALGDQLCSGMIRQLRAWGVQNLKEMGYSLDDLNACIPAIMGDMEMYMCPTRMTAEDVQEILRVAYEF